MASPHTVQRLWLLERPRGCGPSTGSVRMAFAGAVAVLDQNPVHVVVIISDDASRAGERGLLECDAPARLERNAFTFATLDDALEGVDRIKRQFIARGWRDTEHESPYADIDRPKEMP